ncbi:CPBP family intramembrane glutamic endopeptidase [Apilactobacillus ozensis]|uniref:CPBP family intramembrane glutamic endopeptidase n=1 Tax=Apilactobacillus ozensis TaxID=866801 RepID=UPI00200B9ED6|nr:CPBP family intramembrane glutamic endopeptidase [Apilactobacillus ozensis]MCK8607197.1 CPBP family intramembrane metalloprotease [Apilactobacillus ozensis]
MSKIPIFWASYMQIFIIMIVYVFFNKKISRQKIIFNSKILSRYRVIPYLTLLIVSLYLLRPNNLNSSIQFNQVFWLNIANCLGAAIYEEYFARGILLRAILIINKDLKRIGIIISIIVASFIFSCFHIIEALESNSWTEMLVTFLVGIILGSIYISIGSIIPCMFFHFVYDFTVYFLKYNLSGITTFDYTIICILITSIIITPTIYHGLLDKKFYR